MWRKTERPNILGKHENLCWSCAKCISRCPWSERFEEIEGWDAEPDFCSGVTHAYRIRSFKIRNCPEFKEDIR